MNQSQNVATSGPETTQAPQSPHRAAPPLSGEQYVLKFDDQEAIVCSVGAMVREYKVDGRDVFVPFDADQVAPVYNAAILAPWPNRLGGGKFEFEGYIAQLPVNEIDRTNALHGLICWENFSLIRHGHSDITLELDLPARPGWPYQLRFTARYWLNENGLNCRFTATNIGAKAAPYGVGFHPWLSSGGALLDDCEVRLDAAGHVLNNDRLLPTGETEPVSGSFALQTRRSLRGLDLDDAWIDATYDGEGKSWCVLYCPDGKAPAVWMDKSMDVWQVCTSDHIPNFYRFGLAAEPMSCIADAFNTEDRLIRLPPGAMHQVEWGATLLDS